MITITRLRATEKLNEYSGELEATDWDTPDELILKAFGAAPANPYGQRLTDRITEEQLWDLYFYKRFSSKPDILKTDRVAIGQKVYEIIQEPEHWHNELKAGRPWVGTVIRIQLLEELPDSEESV